MPHRLQSENQSLRRQLEALLHEARRNEEKMRRFDQFERRLIATSSLAELIRLLLVDYRVAFELDAVSLVLIDPECEIAQFLVGSEAGARAGLHLQAEGFALENLFRAGFSPLLASYDPGEHGFLFDREQAPASVALLPLACHGRLIGSLNLGSRAAQRFTADSGTEFLGRLAAIAAFCLENACNHERLKLIGLTDPLTGVNNRRYFECRLQEEITRARRHAQALSCMFIDIDKFKRINDSLGHPVGDLVLREVAALVKSQLRGSDIIARYGGEEFVVLLPQTAVRHAAEIAERIRAMVAARRFEPQSGAGLAVSVSIGVAVLPERAGDADSGILAGRLVEEADQALYQAKQGGRNRVVCAGLRAPARPSLWPFPIRAPLGAMLRQFSLGALR